MKGKIAEDSEIEWLSPTSPCNVNEANNSFSRKILLAWYLLPLQVSFAFLLHQFISLLIHRQLNGAPQDGK